MKNYSMIAGIAALSAHYLSSALAEPIGQIRFTNGKEQAVEAMTFTGEIVTVRLSDVTIKMPIKSVKYFEVAGDPTREERIASLQTEIDALKAQIEEQKSKSTNLDARLEAEKLESDKWRAKTQEAERENTKLLAQIAALEDQVSSEPEVDPASPTVQAQAATAQQPMPIVDPFAASNGSRPMPSRALIQPRQSSPPPVTSPSAASVPVSPEPDAAPAASAINFEAFDSVFSPSGSLTELQRKDRFAKFEGVIVRWTGTVGTVNEGGLGGLRLGVKHKPSTLTYDVHVDLLSSEREKALTLQKGSRITYEGKLKSYGGVLAPHVVEAARIVAQP